LTHRKLRLIVLGMMGRCPYGGQSWLYLNWLRGLAANGHDVWYVEDDSVWPYDPEQNTVTDDCRYAARHIETSLARVGLAGKWALRLADRGGACWNMSSAQLDELYRSCDALLNIVGATDLREPQLAAPFRVYVETDPVTAELRLDEGDAHTREAFGNHHAIVTYGENYGAPDCGVPLCGLAFKKTRQPIDLDLWPMAFDPSAKYFTTIGNYRQEGSDVTWRGDTYRWSKHHEWERFIDLPSRTTQPFELAMKCSAADQAFLEKHGWRVVPAFEMSLDIFGRYPAFFRRSRAQFTVAKDQNVRLRSGWFSERDACYLATGKPVVSQDTGFASVLPTGDGLFAFTTADQALAAIDRINSDYAKHCDAARAIAREYFDAKKVAAKMLSDLGM
jgi:hypothetical protein